MEIFQAVNLLRAQLNFGRWPILCTFSYRNPIQASNFNSRIWPMDPLNFFSVFTEDVDLFLLYIMAQKKVKKMTKIKGGGGPTGTKRLKGPTVHEIKALREEKEKKKSKLEVMPKQSCKGLLPETGESRSDKASLLKTDMEFEVAPPRKTCSTREGLCK